MVYCFLPSFLPLEIGTFCVFYCKYVWSRMHRLYSSSSCSSNHLCSHNPYFAWLLNIKCIKECGVCGSLTRMSNNLTLVTHSHTNTHTTCIIRIAADRVKWKFSHWNELIFYTYLKHSQPHWKYTHTSIRIECEPFSFPFFIYLFIYTCTHCTIPWKSL